MRGANYVLAGLEQSQWDMLQQANLGQETAAMMKIISFKKKEA